MFTWTSLLINMHVDWVKATLYGYLRQPNISILNISRHELFIMWILSRLQAFGDKEVAELSLNRASE